ncbi:helix-turn-helix domain-containing protein [Anaeromyxobacter sp. PSR-1]|uniref:helix-turn-helix domain-containing protein n=1 Tax=unclassified Anaeromyxobacter TaxID=2620896 RepID=UPI0007519DA8|nr:helix-turn-helix domain-containing protein [Anaeromyxobacter sp. PSR-1]
MKALLLEGAPDALRRACEAARLEVVEVRSIPDGRARLAREAFALVDGRITRPCALDEELRQRVDAFFDRLHGQPATGLYDAVMREVERPLISGALARARGVRSVAAEALGIDRGTLARRMRALGLDEP